MVNEKVVGSAHYPAMHLNVLPSHPSGSVNCFKTGYGLPSKLGQPVIIAPIDDSKLSAGKGYPPGDGQAEFDIFGRREIGAGIGEKKSPPFSPKTVSAAAGKDGTALADDPG